MKCVIPEKYINVKRKTSVDGLIVYAEISCSLMPNNVYNVSFGHKEEKAFEEKLGYYVTMLTHGYTVQELKKKYSIESDDDEEAEVEIPETDVWNKDWYVVKINASPYRSGTAVEEIFNKIQIGPIKNNAPGIKPGNIKNAWEKGGVVIAPNPID